MKKQGLYEGIINRGYWDGEYGKRFGSKGEYTERKRRNYRWQIDFSRSTANISDGFVYPADYLGRLIVLFRIG